MYLLEIKSSVEKDFRKIPKVQQQKMWEHIQKLKVEPRPKNCRKMVGTESDYRIRVGNYRVVYGYKKNIYQIINHYFSKQNIVSNLVHLLG